MPRQLCIPFDTPTGAILQALGDIDLVPVKVTTYSGEEVVNTEYYAYEFGNSYPDLREDFPRVLGSNQSIEHLTA